MFGPFLLVLSVLMTAIAPATAVEVREAWARATVPGQKVGVTYLTIKSPAAARLLAVNSAICKRVEIHSSSMQGGVMRMRQLKELKLPAGEDVVLAPMGTHLMLMELHGPLRGGDLFKIELVVREGGKRRKIPVQVEVRALAQ